jgi:hypothetical protein
VKEKYKYKPKSIELVRTTHISSTKDIFEDVRVDNGRHDEEKE